MGTRGPVNGINAFLIQELLTHSGHMRPGIVLHQEEPRAHCTSVRSDNRSEDFIPVPNSSQGTVGYDMECEPALICEENGAPMVDLPILVFSRECQSSCTVLGCEHSKPSCDRTYGCAILEELDYLCNLIGLQDKTEAKLFEKFKINWKFGKLVSAIIEKSWPRDVRGHYQEGEEAILQHMLNWTAARDIFHLHGADDKLRGLLSEEAKERMAMATSVFTFITHKVLTGAIKINLLNHILKNPSIFIELLKIGS
ncbi:hypothetical protein SKAU_G00301820 [Synaphobranchus kaupii]|uniref:Uncharacterized protein n=1 Tax=Synaphobranchus kaupii TaxID=118154 RepID=A0A9Q1IN39_SYNKA|nr:hypothetical protein SKAU_G00301820 [Synaphobranchus kaupii]